MACTPCQEAPLTHALPRIHRPDPYVAPARRTDPPVEEKP
jgi:hypothetical protein